MKKLIIYLSLIAALCVAYSLTHAQTWTPNPKYTKSAKDSAKTAGKAQYKCWGTTKKGERCKRKVTGPHSFCYQHTNQQ